MTPFETLNNHIVYTNVKSQNDAVKLKDDALKAVATGKTVVIFFENRYYLHLAPGWDPYQISREIEQYMANPIKAKKSATETSSEPVTTETITTPQKASSKK